MIAQEAFLAAVAAVDPTKLVKRHVRTGALDDWFEDRDHPRPLHVLALGKAAPRMVWGLVEANVPFSGVGAAPKGVPFPQWEGFQWQTGNHPVAGAASFAAGKAVLDWADRLPAHARVLVLLSGGASACCEWPERAIGADIREGLPIEELNRRRAQGSDLKAGRLAARIKARTPDLRVWVLEDAPISVVGSGPCWDGETEHTSLADVDTAIAAAGAALPGAYRFPGRIDGPLETMIERFVAMVRELPPDARALVGGGEPVLAIPADAPPGGRCQHAALLAARALEDLPGWTFLAAGTDGVDGTTKEAGAVVSGADWSGRAAERLAAFDAHGYLAGLDRTFRTGATGTNVADLWLLVRDH